MQPSEEECTGDPLRSPLMTLPACVPAARLSGLYRPKPIGVSGQACAVRVCRAPCPFAAVNEFGAVLRSTLGADSAACAFSPPASPPRQVAEAPADAC